MADDAARIPGWKPLQDWPVSERPENLWPFIACDTSLTERLRTAIGDTFRVTVLSEREGVLDRGDADLLEAEAGARTWVREVYLGGREPCLFARTSTLADEAGAKLLRELGETPLGDRVFAGGAVRRGEIQVTRLQVGDPFYREATQPLNKSFSGVPLWARRSVLAAGGALFLICECFLREP